MNGCIIIDINEEIKKTTIQIKQKHQIKLPDSIIAATTLFIEIPLLTADKGFKKINKLNLALFEEYVCWDAVAVRPRFQLLCFELQTLFHFKFLVCIAIS